jgi:MYXO-CTERM domain-containing protein
MKRFLLCAILGAVATAPAMYADVVDYLLNVNGTDYCESGSGTGCANTGFPAGASSSLDLSYDSGGTNTGPGSPFGLGTVSMTFGPGTYNVGLWLFEELVPVSGYDEYGATGGSLGAGESWQIDVPDYDYNGSDPNFGSLPAGAGTIIANTEAGTLADTNYVTGNSDAFDFICSGSSTCNDFTSTALAYSFVVGSGDEGTLSFTESTTAPTSGFYLEQIAPVDGANPTEMDYFYSASLDISPVCTANCSPVPEPRSTIPLLALAGMLALAVWRRRSATV